MSNISPKQLTANRKNAKHGGVKSEEGKAVCKYNAMKHGLLSKEVSLHDEDDADIIALGKKLRSELAPESAIELVLVDRVTANVWRLRRAMQIEREMMEDDRQPAYGNKLKTVGEAMSFDFGNSDTYSKFIRYEASIERGIYKALHELQRMQAARSGKEVSAPIVIDIDDDREKYAK